MIKSRPPPPPPCFQIKKFSIHYKVPENAPEAVSDSLKFKIFWGSMPPDPPSVHVLMYIGSCYTELHQQQASSEVTRRWRVLSHAIKAVLCTHCMITHLVINMWANIALASSLGSLVPSPPPQLLYSIDPYCMLP